MRPPNRPISSYAAGISRWGPTSSFKNTNKQKFICTTRAWSHISINQLIRNEDLPIPPANRKSLIALPDQTQLSLKHRWNHLLSIYPNKFQVPLAFMWSNEKRASLSRPLHSHRHQPALPVLSIEKTPFFTISIQKSKNLIPFDRLFSESEEHHYIAYHEVLNPPKFSFFHGKYLRISFC